MKQADFNRILPILETLKEREMREMNRLQSEISSARGQLSALDAEEGRISKSLSETVDPATQASAISWRRWNQQQRISINLQIAQLMVEKEALRARLATAVGRHDVVSKLSERARVDRMKRRA